MNISILGAGAMGSLFGGLLAESGQSVTLLDINDTHLEAIRRQGLRLDTDSGERRVGGLSACRPEQVTGQPDLLLVFTKAQHTDSALRSIAGHIGEHTRVLTLQNGLGNAEALCRHVAPQQVMIGMTTWPADMVGPAHVRSHGQGVVRLLSLEGVERQASTQVAAVLEAAGLHCAEDPQVWTSIWEKVAFNAALNSLCAVTGCTVGQLDGVPQGRRWPGPSCWRCSVSRSRWGWPRMRGAAWTAWPMPSPTIGRTSRRCCKTCWPADPRKSARSMARSWPGRARPASTCRTPKPCWGCCA